MKRIFVLFLLAAAAPFASVTVQAHFLILFPQDQLIDQGLSRTLKFPISFTHPMSMGPSMDIVKPESVGYVLNNKTTDLTSTLTAVKYLGAAGWQLIYPLRRPGTYTFFAKQTPYIEKTENVVITQYAKVVVDAFAAGGDWHPQLHTPVEIMPLTRPYALWTNSVFTGRVLVNNQPAADVAIEVEYYNAQGLSVPSDAYLSQELITNSLGEFTVALPQQGWWGIAALVEDEQPITVDGTAYPHERAGIIWLQVQDFN